MKIRNLNSIKSKHWLLILLAVGVLLVGIDSLTDGKTPIRYLTSYTIVPLQKGISNVGAWMNDFSDSYKTLAEMKEQNKELENRVNELTTENIRLNQNQFELERLRDLYKLDEDYSDYEKVGARVIANNGSNWFSDFLIDKGSKDGIKKNATVLAGAGLVGIVTEVNSHTAIVRSIIDDASNVSGMILSTSDTCVVRGDLTELSNGKIPFEKLANNDNVVEVGEQIVTSHISPSFLQGILIGYVSEVNVDANKLTRSGYITPAVDFSKLQEVLVITTTKEELTQSKE
ncbi:rod shape-determining protein MreC [Aequitasia blattaphilus]|uniref:Cell shape-determining protein MreC n=1 Tax=Aequitasia blattaphilus TaxID=2949332 RepID=A0ABT1E782_9FIRM|nr:rod shape-determining protein MreC [Aequitasia blattaphilus]MCP1101693.1 rod shape-determining protein MreC [Aequitasia blattaphilus]MCR8614333.1 rod shape-determining protein MreC [Aequitasia blattaphilus]